MVWCGPVVKQIYLLGWILQKYLQFSPAIGMLASLGKIDVHSIVLETDEGDACSLSMKRRHRLFKRRHRSWKCIAKVVVV